MEFLALVLHEVTFIGMNVLFLLVALLVSEFVLHLVASETEHDDACDLNADVPIGTGSVSSEESDGGGDHVGAEEGGGVDHELVCVVVPVVAADDSREELEDELGVGGGEVAKEDCVAD